MSADNGFRIGTKENMWPRGGDWRWVHGKHPKFDQIRKDPHKMEKFDNTLKVVEDRIQRSLDLVRLLRTMLVGGHVRADKLASLRGYLDERSDPEVALATAAEAIKVAE